MNFAVTELTNSIFKKPLHECSLDELQQLTRQYPYFGPVQLLLTKKLQEDNSSLYEEQVQKTTLYFQNRVWLHHLLNDSGRNKLIIDHPAITEKEVPVADEEQNQPAEPIANQYKEEEIHNLIKEETTEPAKPQAKTAAIEIESIFQPLTGENNNEVLPIPEPEKEETTEQTSFEIQAIIPELIVRPLTDENTEVELIPEPDKEEEGEQTAAPFEMPSLKIESITANSGIIFEPYHTVDYFASQGIKFREDEKAKDRFSQQLKSFTEWLKIMKRIPVTEIAANDTGIEKKVEQMAEYSLAERHVITEAMAEVWEKQGNKIKAEDIYRKLSLLDPSKSSYFAAKIEELKKQS